jgi:wobble nucleotide-excising tRNase
MLKKIIKIKNIGKLKDYNSSGDVWLKRYNLFFAENGRGKTTLSTIIRSLCTGNSQLITGRTTLGQDEKPAVEILIDNKSYKFNQDSWEEHYPNCKIFDSSYINENVCAGDYVDIEHKKNLCKVIIGADGIRLNENVEILNADILQKNSSIRELKKQIQSIIPQDFSFEKFIDLSPLDNIQEQITAKNSELNGARKASEIKSKPILKKINLEKLPDNLESKLLESLEGISAEAEDRVQVQIKKHNMNTYGYDWLLKGSSFNNLDDCPFCGKESSSNELIKSYKEYFSVAYNNFKKEIEELLPLNEKYLGEGVCIQFAETIAENNSGYNYWKQYISLTDFVVGQSSLFRKIIQDYKEQVAKIISIKISSILEPVSFDDNYINTKKSFEQLLADIEEYNSLVAEFNIMINDFKHNTATANITELESCIKLLKLTEKRYEDPTKDLCNKYKNILTDKIKKENEKQLAKQQLDDYTENVIGKYESKINDFLSKFGADFRITKTKLSFPGGLPSSSYQILINDIPIEIGDKNSSIVHPCFRNTLSSGDKSILALSFFLSELYNDTDKSNKIVVFDDPFNSQDRSRRECTKELIKNVGALCKQVIVLSHDPYFLKLVWDGITDKSLKKALQLERAGAINTIINEWDIEKETKDGYFLLHDELRSYLANGRQDLRAVAQKIRPLLEGYCRYRFPNQFADDRWLGDMIEKIRSEQNHPLFLVCDELGLINGFSKKYHHDTNPGADSEYINDGELNNFVRKTLKIVDGY